MTSAAHHRTPLASAPTTIAAAVQPHISPSNSRLVADFSIVRDDYHIRFVPKEGPLRQDVDRLIQRMYASRGLNTDPAAAPSLPREQTTVAVCKGDKVFGTLTAAMDVGHGLLADTLYRTEIDSVRAQGAKVCEVTRLAIDPDEGSPQAMAALFHMAVIITRSVYGMSDCFIEVNPRHAPYYRRMMGYRVAGPNLICPRVGAPATLLQLSLSHAMQQAIEHGGSNCAKRKGLYGMFFSPAEQKEILRLILTNSTERRATPRAPAN